MRGFWLDFRSTVPTRHVLGTVLERLGGAFWATCVGARPAGHPAGPALGPARQSSRLNFGGSRREAGRL
jgi:hypothetical protein